MSRRCSLTALLLLVGCVTPTSTASAQRLARLEAGNAANDDKVADLDSRAQQIQQATRDLIAAWTRVEADLRSATAALEGAARQWDQASEAYREAERDYQAAARAWKVVAATMMVAAMSNGGASSLCGGQMNTAQIRRVWKRQGYDLTGVDADHIWPKSLGGANHPWNFQQMNSSLNRSLGNGLSWKLLNEPIALLRGGAVSAMVALTCR